MDDKHDNNDNKDNCTIYNSEESINSITPTSAETETMEKKIEEVIKSFPDDDNRKFVQN
jgi:hypothetical protein